MTSDRPPPLKKPDISLITRNNNEILGTYFFSVEFFIRPGIMACDNLPVEGSRADW